jgi:hypothetical protein
VTDPRLRASDDDRHRVVAALERHTAAGRLTLDEFGERVSRVLAAVTHGELAAVTSDLPPEPAEAGAPTPQALQLVVAFLLAAVTLVVLAVVFALLHH